MYSAVVIGWIKEYSFASFSRMEKVQSVEPRSTTNTSADKYELLDVFDICHATERTMPSIESSAFFVVITKWALQNPFSENWISAVFLRKNRGIPQTIKLKSIMDIIKQSIKAASFVRSICFYLKSVTKKRKCKLNMILYWL